VFDNAVCLAFYDQYENEFDLFWNISKMYVPASMP